MQPIFHQESPGGPNIISSRVTSNQKKIYKTILFKLIRSIASMEDITDHIKYFLDAVNNTNVQQAYQVIMGNTTKSKDLLAEVDVLTGRYWHVMKMALENIVVEQKHYLAEVFMDDTIQRIIAQT
jgi:hypothetical protein